MADVLTKAEREAIAHARAVGPQHSTTSCPPFSRAMCPHRAALKSAAAKGITP